MLCRRLATALVGLALLASSSPTAAQEVTTADLGAMSFRHIGPVGNRVTSVTGVIGDRFTYYAGAASGGI